MSAQVAALHAIMAQIRAGQKEQARAALQRFVTRHPDNADGSHLLASVLMELRELERAEYFARRAVDLRPKAAPYLNTLGGILLQAGRMQDARAAFERCVELDPSFAHGWAGLGAALYALRDFQAAIDAGRRCVAAAPNVPFGYVNLAGCLAEAGRVEECIGILKEARLRFPAHPAPLAALVPEVHYAHDIGPDEILDHHTAYGAMLSATAPRLPEPSNDPDPERPLRIAYLSADFREHSVAYYVESLLRHHDRSRFHVTAYSLTVKPDQVTERLAGMVDRWVPMHGTPDDALVHRVRSDRIDVLVEMSGHTSGNRLRALASRAAPVQVSYIGYPSTTGVRAIDYRVVDGFTDPPGAEGHATETLVRLDPCFLCYTPPASSPEVAPPPCRENGHVTFGSFNALRKHTPVVLELWARILREVPGSRLVLKNRSFADPPIRESTQARFEALGVDPARVDLLAPAKSTSEHLGYYGRVDIGLDPFPYNGTTTTCEALWMGVPVVSLAGDRHAARVGLSLLSVVGLGDLCAADESGYVEAAKSLARSPDRLAELRSGMRDRLRGSALLDGPGHARRVEEAYRRMWQAWCRTRTGKGGA